MNIKGGISMKQALINLLKVKTIVTLIITVCLAVGFLRGQISVDLFMPIVTLVLGFYFTKDIIKEE